MLMLKGIYGIFHCKNIDATENTRNVYSRDVIKIKFTQLWFSKFRLGDFSLTVTRRLLKTDDDMCYWP